MSLTPLPQPSLAEAVFAAQTQGWTLQTQTQTTAVLFTPARPAVNANFHIINAIVSVITCGIWLIPWLIIWGIAALAGGQPARRLFIINTPHGIQYVVRDV